MNQLNHTSYVIDTTLTDSPILVRSGCVIEDFGGLFVLLLCLFEFSVGIGAFVVGMSHISSFFLFNLIVFYHTKQQNGALKCFESRKRDFYFFLIFLWIWKKKQQIIS